ncbi:MULTISPECIES: I78 family peptidase inhibitor [unclassified Yoonia]|uniref:I78 family peptidase inhibitor n=1 Tax=unclassified Yoonia TaxID=2629118 RepID=UPI002AFF638B|nr:MULTISPECIES: I78 family peptidase inhibitor [unclassified Yoonia]
MRILIPLLLLAACATVDNPGTAPTLPDTCGASEYTYLVGQPDTALQRVLIMDEVRIIRPDTMVTMDFRPERINFKIDAQGRIADVTCG